MKIHSVGTIKTMISTNKVKNADKKQKKIKAMSKEKRPKQKKIKPKNKNN